MIGGFHRPSLGAGLGGGIAFKVLALLFICFLWGSLFVLVELRFEGDQRALVAKMSSSIPQPPGLPIIGNLLDVKPGNTWGSFNKLAVKYRRFYLFLFLS